MKLALILPNRKEGLSAAHLTLFVALSAAASPCLAQTRPSADLIITNAKVFTAVRERERGEAVAVLGDRLVAVGSAKEVDVWRGERTRVINANGRLLLPGFNDSHLHISSVGASLDREQLRDAGTLEEFRRRMAERAARTPKGEWVLGGDWDHENFTPAELPTRELLDPVTKDTPVWVTRDGQPIEHAGTEALAIARDCLK